MEKLEKRPRVDQQLPKPEPRITPSSPSATPVFLHDPTFTQFFPKNADAGHLLSAQELNARQANAAMVFETTKGSQKLKNPP
jgi:hypothetical protein